MAAKLLGERLPLNWSYGVTEDGRIFFIDDSTQQTTWLHPVTGEPVQTGYSTTAELPAGWERALTINGTIYFIDHNRHCTTFEHPVTGHSVMDGPAREAPLSPQSLSTPGRKGSGKTKPIKAPTASREENSKVILRGWLHKQDSGGLKLWKKKWCVLADFGLFFYKDEMEGNCIGSILLPSYSISPCKPHDANKKFAFKAEHENMKTFYFAAENQPEMDKWVEALRMAALVQRAPGSGLPKLIPKSPIMSWDDNVDTAGISPPDMQQYPFSGSRPDPRSPGSEHNRSFNDRQPLQARENVQNFSDPYRGQGHDTRSAAEFGTYSRQPQNPMSPNQQFDPRYPSDRMDKTRGSQRSNQSQGQIMPEDQKSMSSQRSNQHFSNTLPRNPRSNQLDTSMRSMGSQQSQGYNSLPRDPRPRVAEGQDIPYSHSSPRQPQSNRGQNTVRQPAQREEKNPYMMMTPHRNDVRKMDPYKNSNRPLPQEPPLEPVHERSRSGGGDYASLSRIRDKKYQQLSEDPGTGERIEPRQAVPNQLSPSQLQRPDLYVDVPHTYVNVYDQSQVRDLPPDLPSRPPLPAEMRPRLVEDIAKTHSPNTQREMIMAERNLELRMKQPSFFNYPTPDREALPKFPQPGDSPRSQTSQRSQRSQKPLLPQQPDIASMYRSQEPNQLYDPNNSYLKPSDQYDQNYNVNTSTLSSNLNDSDTTLTNEDERNDKINEFYGLGKYNTKGAYPQKEKTRFMSDIDVRSNTMPSKPLTGVTGEKDFRLRSLPEHVQSMPALYHEQQPLSIVVPDRNAVINSYIDLAPSSRPSDSSQVNGHDTTDTMDRKSAFRPLSSSGSSSLQRIPSSDLGAPEYSRPLKNSDRYDRGQSSIQPSQNELPWKQEFAPNQRKGQGQQKGFQGRSEGMRSGQGAGPIHTVKEEPDMPDSQVIETDLPKRVFPLNGPRLRMSISATDLLGKTHDELVLLLIQLRRDKADLHEQRDGIRKTIEQNRPAEFFYRKLQNEGRPIDPEKEIQHRKYMDMKHKVEDVEKRLEVYKPLVNLVCNMVTMGSLYGGDNLMLATEYRKHLLSPEQYSPPKKMLEFSRRRQEEQIVQEIEEDVRQLTQEQADLHEKREKLNSLDRVLQEQAFQVTGLKEDRVASLAEKKEMLEKALGGLLKKQDQHVTNPRELDILVQQQKTIERELSRVLQQLADASKELEETTAENNRLEHEVALLQSQVYGNVSRSKSAPALSSESLRTKMKMERDLAKVKDIMEGLSEEGARLQEMISTLKRPKPGDGQPNGSSPNVISPGDKSSDKADGRLAQIGSTYYETDLDSGECKNLGHVSALLASFPHYQPVSDRSPPASGNSLFKPVDSEKPLHATSAASTFQKPASANHIQADDGTDGLPNQWDIGDAEDNTKRFFGLLPKNMPKQQTVRDVKRHADARKKKEDDPPPLHVGVVPSEYTHSESHVYENLPHQMASSPTQPQPPWAPAVVTSEVEPVGKQRRRSNLHLITPKPFTLNSKPTPFSSVNNVSSLPQYRSVSSNLDQTDAPLQSINIQNNQSQPSLQNGGVNADLSKSNDTYQPTESMRTQPSNKTPPPPPVRESSKYITAEVSHQNFADILGKSPTNRNYERPVPTILKKGKNNRALNKMRYMTISSSEPVKLEKSSPHSPKLHSQAGDLITSLDVPDIVKSSTTKADMFDERTIDREVLFRPAKVEIPERYIPDSDDESVTEEEKVKRREKADKIKRILTQQSVHSLSQPDVSRVAGEVHERVQQQKQQRALLLGINQELAEQVKRKSRQYAAERRKTWSGSNNKPEEDVSANHAETDDEQHGGDSNNNSFLSSDTGKYTSPKNSNDLQDRYNPRNYQQEKGYTQAGRYQGDEDFSVDDEQYSGQYSEDSYSKGDNSYLRGKAYFKEDNSYTMGGNSSGYPDMYNSTSYSEQPNFKI
ncbi:uncharacterized protein LOC127837513 isoform X3 [Dreissena polymorpha]|uniref:uncharacterized protein LOC127837513 isoform X3 n=1 Tax=Dreissena polymorpha TaxID=45954 RepID=UPI0022647E2B|nr:uncharacterized protein LOC127837513 isoform X3 [Dreissena polymorpha]